mmetsp:Transcript_39243/g.98745  ORF Transcript_39243/g.98745 Transcript_39243/m.98745 type:complete len:1294 (-) Transcript_39243:41-3922(-)
MADTAAGAGAAVSSAPVAGESGDGAVSSTAPAVATKPRPKEASRRVGAASAVDQAGVIFESAQKTTVKAGDAVGHVAGDAADALAQAADAAQQAIEGTKDDVAQGLEEAEREEEDELQALGQPEDAGRFGRLTRFFKGGGKPQQEQARTRAMMDMAQRPEDKMRYWDLQLAIRSMNYVGGDDQIDTFFAVSIIPSEPEKVKSRVRLLPEYSPACILNKNEIKTLDTPFQLWRGKIFKMPYKELEKYILKVAMWKVSKMTFNTYYGRGQRSLAKIVRNEANIQFAVKEKLTKEAEERKKKRRMAQSDVAMLGLTVNLEEIFDFQLQCENWSLELRKEHPNWKKHRKDERKCLTFVVPKSKFSDASSNRVCYTQTVRWKGPEDKQKCVWTTLETKEPFRFRGTPTALQNQFLIVRVHSMKTLHDNQPTLGKTIGCALMNLTSILDISVFTGRVKDLQAEKDKFNVGLVTGSIKAVMCSMTLKYTEDIKGGRPQQPKTATTVGHLNPMEKHLVIRVTKCDGLAVADVDTATSDPYLRCTWDNMVQKSGVLKETVRPVFNFNFFFPVRLFNRNLLKKTYRHSALKFELESKGDISIQVWDDDDTSADSLGFVKLPLAKILNSKSYVIRTLRGPVPKAKDDEEGGNAPSTNKQWFEQEREVRLFDGTKTELLGCSLPNPNTPYIYFEAYFYPDWPDDVLVEELDDDAGAGSKWEQKEKDFTTAGTAFAKKYAEPFPDAIGARPAQSETFNKTVNLRRFLCIGKHPQTMEDLPLMAFPCKIITPHEYTRPLSLMHWINCITFSNSSRQERLGELPKDGWKDPQTFLFTRKGPVQDHALLLCSVLLGAKKDAYICKGTIKVESEDKRESRLVEHVWVMTREQGDWVSFWEPCQREIYHLPKRWQKDQNKRKKATGDAAAGEGANGEGEEDDDKDNTVAVQQEAWANEIPDMALGMEDIEMLPTVGRMPKPKQRVASKKVNPRDKMKADLMKQREKLRVAPRTTNPNLCEEDVTLVDWLPYDSIDIVFNMDNLWANRQNHHPACITYNFTSEKEGEEPCWEPLIGEPYEKERQEYDWRPINDEVVIDPALTSDKIEKREQDMICEAEENMRLSRGKKGMDTFFEKGERLVRQLSDFLTLLERMRKLDIDFCPCLDKMYEDWSESEKYMMTLRCGTTDPQQLGEQRFNKYGSAFGHENNDRYKGYPEEQTKEWRQLEEDMANFRKGSFEVQRGKEFTGLPVHFCTSDKEEIRGYLMNMKEYQDIAANDKDGAVHTVHCKMFPMLGGVQSTWLYIGMQVPTDA